MRLHYYFILLLFILIYGCSASGFDQGVIKKSLNYETVTSDEEIQRILNLKSQLKAPFRLGIYLDQKALDWREKKYWRWLEDDRDSLVGRFKEYYGELFSDVFFIPSSMVGQASLLEIRTAAARHNADAVLVFRGVSDVDTYGNFWSWTYLTLIMGWIVPGTDVDTYFKMNAALWDVRNEYLYCTAEIDEYKNFSTPGLLVSGNKKQAIEESKKEVFDKLISELKIRLNNLYIAPQGGTY